MVWYRVTGREGCKLLCAAQEEGLSALTAVAACNCSRLVEGLVELALGAGAQEECNLKVQLSSRCRHGIHLGIGERRDGRVEQNCDGCQVPGEARATIRSAWGRSSRAESGHASEIAARPIEARHQAQQQPDRRRH